MFYFILIVLKFIKDCIRNFFYLLSVVNGINLLLYRIDDWQGISDTHGHDCRQSKSKFGEILIAMIQ